MPPKWSATASQQRWWQWRGELAPTAGSIRKHARSTTDAAGPARWRRFRCCCIVWKRWLLHGRTGHRAAERRKMGRQAHQTPEWHDKKIKDTGAVRSAMCHSARSTSRARRPVGITDLCTALGEGNRRGTGRHELSIEFQPVRRKSVAIVASGDVDREGGQPTSRASHAGRV